MNTRTITTIASLCFSLSAFFSCTGEKKDNQLSESEKKEGWTLLFDGVSTKGWHPYNNDQRTLTWSVSNGELVCGPDVRFDHLDLVTDKEYRNFELTFDWKINKGGNSGVFIDVQERPDLKATWASGPEYQLLESTHPDVKDSTKLTGGIFGFTSPVNTSAPTPAGQWNSSRIKQQDGRVEFYLNGALTLKVDLTSRAWADAVGKTHFSSSPEFGKHTSGHIALQDWQKVIAFKNVKIREL